VKYRRIQVLKVINWYNRHLAMPPKLYRADKVLLIMELRRYAICREMGAFMGKE
jgi:hypothetical protein